jgi:hypothetical protein
MADHAFPCPHCGAEQFGFRIIWAKVAPCLKCRRPIYRSANAFATNVMLFCEVFGWLVLSVPGAVWILWNWTNAPVGWRIFSAIVFPVLAALQLGLVALLGAFAWAPFRPEGGSLTDAWESPASLDLDSTFSMTPVQSVPLACPSCRSDLRGNEIALANRSAFGGQTHFSRVIGIYSHADDATVAWQCPDCGHEWPRTEPFSPGLRNYQLIARFGPSPEEGGQPA